MNDIERPSSLRQIEPSFDKPVIKVLTGMRGVGKSSLLRLLMRHFAQRGVSDSQIIYINTESMDEISFAMRPICTDTSPGGSMPLPANHICSSMKSRRSPAGSGLSTHCLPTIARTSRSRDQAPISCRRSSRRSSPGVTSNSPSCHLPIESFFCSGG